MITYSTRRRKFLLHLEKQNSTCRLVTSYVHTIFYVLYQNKYKKKYTQTHLRLYVLTNG